MTETLESPKQPEMSRGEQVSICGSGCCLLLTTALILLPVVNRLLSGLRLYESDVQGLWVGITLVIVILFLLLITWKGGSIPMLRIGVLISGLVVLIMYLTPALLGWRIMFGDPLMFIAFLLPPAVLLLLLGIYVLYKGRVS